MDSTLESSRNLQKRGQIEIIGLLFIIILFALGILFSLYFLLGEGSAESGQQVKDSILASSTLSTLRKTSTTCYDRTVEELIEDCARTQGSLTCPDGTNTCDKADEVMTTILNSLFLDTLQRNYSMTLLGTSYFTEPYGQESCPGELESKEEPIPVGVGFEVLIRLDLCR
jgi:hypothetical protein